MYNTILDLSITALYLNLVLLILTLPVFYILKNGKEIELPITMIVLTLAVTGVLSAQISFLNKDKYIEAKTIGYTALIQSVLMILIQIYIFIDIPSIYYWYSISSILLIITFIVVLSIQIYRMKML